MPESMGLPADSGADIKLESFNIHYRGNRHYFYDKHGTTLPGYNNPSGSSGSSSYGIFLTGGAYNHSSSDDRLKHNEIVIVDALATVRKLSPQKYQKTDVMKDEDYMGPVDEPYRNEAGFIAQEVLEIPELAYAVSEGLHVDPDGAEHSIFYLRYQEIFVHAVAAIKELDATVQAQAAQLTTQAARLDILEARLARLTNALT